MSTKHLLIENEVLCELWWYRKVADIRIDKRLLSPSKGMISIFATTTSKYSFPQRYCNKISCWPVTPIQYQNLKFLVLHVHVCGMVLRHRCNFILEGSGLLGCDTMSFNEVLLNMSKEMQQLQLQGTSSPRNILGLPKHWKWKHCVHWKCSGTTHIPEHLNSQQQCCKNIRSCSFIITIQYFTSTVNIVSAMFCSKTFNVNKTVEICSPTVAAAQSCLTVSSPEGYLRKN